MAITTPTRAPTSTHARKYMSASDYQSDNQDDKEGGPKADGWDNREYAVEDSDEEHHGPCEDQGNKCREEDGE